MATTRRIPKRLSKILSCINDLKACAPEDSILFQMELSSVIEKLQMSLIRLDREKAYLEEILSQMPAGAVIVESSHGKILLANDQIKKILRSGSSPLETIEQFTQYARFYPDGRPYGQEDLPLMRSLLLGEVVEDEEIHLVRGDGTIGIMNASSAPILDEDGKIIAAVVFFYDITDRRQMIEALRQSEQHYRLLFETMLKGVIYLDANGTVLSMNPAAGRILGKSQAEFLGSSSIGQEHSAIREDGSPFPGMEHPARIALKTGEKVQDVVMGVYNPRENCYRWINIDAIPIFGPEEKKPYQVYMSFEDIT